MSSRLRLVWPDVQNVLELSICPVLEYTLVQGELPSHYSVALLTPGVPPPMDSTETDKGIRVFSTFRA